MNKTRVISSILLVVILGCVIAQSYANSIQARSKRSIDDGEADEAPQKGKGKKGKKGEAGNGTAEAIRSDPENSRRYQEHSVRNFEGMQGIIDKHFAKKKKEGDEISAQGERSQAEAHGTQLRFEQGHYDDMYRGFKYAENSMKQAVAEGTSSKEEEDTATPKGKIDKPKAGNRRNSKGKAEKVKPAPPPPEPEPSEEEPEEEGGAANGPIDESDEEI